MAAHVADSKAHLDVQAERAESRTAALSSCLVQWQCSEELHVYDRLQQSRHTPVSLLLWHHANASASHAFLKFVNSLNSPECSPYQEAKYTRPSQKHASQPCLPIHCQLRPHTDKCPGSNRIDCRLLYKALLMFAGPVCTLQSTQPPLVCSVVRVLRQ